jgi:hypothetical protein
MKSTWERNLRKPKGKIKLNNFGEGIKGRRFVERLLIGSKVRTPLRSLFWGEGKI